MAVGLARNKFLRHRKHNGGPLGWVDFIGGKDHGHMRWFAMGENEGDLIVGERSAIFVTDHRALLKELPRTTTFSRMRCRHHSDLLNLDTHNRDVDEAFWHD